MFVLKRQVTIINYFLPFQKGTILWFTVCFYVNPAPSETGQRNKYFYFNNNNNNNQPYLQRVTHLVNKY